MSVDWKKLNHELPDGFEKYVVMLADACSADNEVKLIGRFQKVVRLIYDEKVLPTKENFKKYVEADEIIRRSEPAE